MSVKLNDADGAKWFAMSKANQNLANDSVRHAIQYIDGCESSLLSRSECVRLCTVAVLYALTHEEVVR